MAVAQHVRDQQNIDEMLRRALERIIQLYTDKAHFIYELLQNAEDAQATIVKFHQKDDCLEVLHNGAPFTSDNLKGLCDIGASDKTDNLNQIGEFGVGFKSVFGICERVRLYSMPCNCNNSNEALPPFGIEIEDFIVPSDIKLEPIPEPFTTKFVFPYCVGKDFSGFKTIDVLKQAVAERLRNLGLNTLLFMRHLNTIEYEIECKGISGSGCYMLEEKKATQLCTIVTAIGATDENEEELSYLKYSKVIPTIINAQRTVDIAYPVVIEKDGTYRFQKTTTPYISVYFPTETESKLQLIVQGPYRTTPNRSSIPFDDEDNIMLAKLTADLLYESVLDIKAQGQMSLQLLNILPLSKPEYFNNWLFRPLYDKTIELFENEDILPTADGGFISGEYAKIARGQELINIFQGELLGELINDEIGTFDNDDETITVIISYQWLPAQLTENNKELGALYSFLTNELDIDIIRPEDLRRYFLLNRDFFHNRDNAWLEKFYKYLEKNLNLINPANYGRNMLTIPFVKTADECFVAPFRKHDTNLLPNVFMPKNNIIEGFQFVHPFLAEQCYSFFTQILQLTQPDEYEYFKKEIERRYGKGTTTIEVTDKEHIEDIKAALEYLALSKYRKDLQDTLSKLSFIKCKDDEKVVFVNPSKTDVYFEKSDEGISIKNYFDSDVNIYFVDTSFYYENGIERQNLNLFGIKGSLITGLENLGWYYPGEGNAQWCDDGDFRSKLDFINIDKVINFIENNSESGLAKEKSKIIMQLLLCVEKRLVGETIKGKTVRNREKAQAKIIDVLTLGRRRHYTPKPKWLFDRNGRVVNPREISKYDLDTDVYGKLNHDSNIYSILGFAHTQQDEIEDALASIACMLEKDDQVEDSILDRLLIKHLGMELAEVKEKLTYLENYEKGIKKYSNTNDKEEYFDPDADIYEYKFPSRPIKNFGRLRKSVEEQYFTAPKVKYEIREMSIRVSKDGNKNRTYLEAMYSCEDNRTVYMCQLCKKPSHYYEAVQIEKEPNLELWQMHLLLCPNCAVSFRGLRNQPTIISEFISRLSDADENQDEPVCVPMDSITLNFTSIHIAEIKEIIRLNTIAKVNVGERVANYE